MFSTTGRLSVAVTVLALVASSTRAMEANDVARLAKAKVGDEVIIAQIKAAKARFALTADEIIRLKKEGVSDAVLRFMIETAARPRQEPPAGKSADPSPAGSGEAGAKPGAKDMGQYHVVGQFWNLGFPFPQVCQKTPLGLFAWRTAESWRGSRCG